MSEKKPKRCQECNCYPSQAWKKRACEDCEKNYKKNK